MPAKHIGFILLVIVSWGFSFVVTKTALLGAPPLLLGAFRFSTLIIPALFITFPKIKITWLMGYILTMGFSQFAFLFTAIKFGMPSGLASLVMQSQAFFTIVMGAFFLKEHIKPQTLFGLGLAVLGLVIIGSDAGVNMTMIGLILTLGAAFSWATGNIIIKKIPSVNTLSLTIWGSALATVPLAIASVIFEGQEVIKYSLIHMNLTTFFSILYLGFIATLLAYGIWAKMLSRYPTSLIAPFSLLVPIIGISSSAFFLNEHLTLPEVIGALIVMLGLIINVFGHQFLPLIKKFNN